MKERLFIDIRLIKERPNDKGLMKQRCANLPLQQNLLIRAKVEGWLVFSIFLPIHQGMSFQTLRDPESFESNTIKHL